MGSLVHNVEKEEQVLVRTVGSEDTGKAGLEGRKEEVVGEVESPAVGVAVEPIQVVASAVRCDASHMQLLVVEH